MAGYYDSDSRIFTANTGTKFKLLLPGESLNKLVRSSRTIPMWFTEEASLTSRNSTLCVTLAPVEDHVRKGNAAREDLRATLIFYTDWLYLTQAENEFGPVSP